MRGGSQSRAQEEVVREGLDRRFGKKSREEVLKGHERRSSKRSSYTVREAVRKEMRGSREKSTERKSYGEGGKQVGRGGPARLRGKSGEEVMREGRNRMSHEENC